MPTLVRKRLAGPSPAPGLSGAGPGHKTMPGWNHPGSLDSSVDGDQQASSAGRRFLSQTDGLDSSGPDRVASMKSHGAGKTPLELTVRLSSELPAQDTRGEVQNTGMRHLRRRIAPGQAAGNHPYGLGWSVGALASRDTRAISKWKNKKSKWIAERS